MGGFKQLLASDEVALVRGVFCVALMQNFSSHRERDRELTEDQAGLSGLVHYLFKARTQKVCSSASSSFVAMRPLIPGQSSGWRRTSRARILFSAATPTNPWPAWLPASRCPTTRADALDGVLAPVLFTIPIRLLEACPFLRLRWSHPHRRLSSVSLSCRWHSATYCRCESLGREDRRRGLRFRLSRFPKGLLRERSCELYRVL